MRKVNPYCYPHDLDSDTTMRPKHLFYLNLSQGQTNKSAKVVQAFKQPSPRVGTWRRKPESELTNEITNGVIIQDKPLIVLHRTYRQKAYKIIGCSFRFHTPLTPLEPSTKTLAQKIIPSRCYLYRTSPRIPNFIRKLIFLRSSPSSLDSVRNQATAANQQRNSISSQVPKKKRNIPDSHYKTADDPAHQPSGPPAFGHGYYSAYSDSQLVC